VISGQSGPDSDRAELVMEQLERSLMLLEEDYRQTIQVGRVGTEAAEGGGAESNSGEEEFGDFQGGDPHPGEGYAALGDGSDSEDFANDFEDEAGNPHASNKGWWNEAEAAATVSGVNAAGSSDPARYGALSAEEIKTIKDVMSSLDIPAPPWAKALDDRILQEQMSSLVARNRAGIPPS